MTVKPKGRQAVEVRMSRIESGGDCECCGFYLDEDLTVTVDGVVVGQYSTDGHFGYSRIDEAQVEADIAKAVGVEAIYPAFCVTRQTRYDKVSEMMDAANTDEEIDVVNKAYESTGRSFADWLKSLGHEVIEEFDVAESPVYDDDDYGDD